MNMSKVLEWIKRYWLVTTGIVVILVLVVGFIGLSHYSGNKTELTVSPEVTTSTPPATSNSQLSFSLKLQTGFPVISASLKIITSATAPSMKVVLAKDSSGHLSGSLTVPPEWLKKPQTITFGLYINGIKTSKTARFAVTDIPITLPPDPGEAGKATLAGIDSDNDGVRDDLQREIVFLYPNNDEVRRVLRAMIKKEQQVITTEGDHEHFKELKVAYLGFWDCYNYLIFGSGIRDYTKGDILWDMLRNTYERKQKDEERQYLATPYATSVGSIHACENVQGQY